MSGPKLTTMLNQIAANFAAYSDAEAARSAAAHVRSFWPPVMRDELKALLARGEGGLTPLAAAAARLLVEDEHKT
jgi:hypothetical protein